MTTMTMTQIHTRQDLITIRKDMLLCVRFYKIYCSILKSKNKLPASVPNLSKGTLMKNVFHYRKQVEQYILVLEEWLAWQQLDRNFVTTYDLCKGVDRYISI